MGLGQRYYCGVVLGVDISDHLETEIGIVHVETLGRTWCRVALFVSVQVLPII